MHFFDLLKCFQETERNENKQYKGIFNVLFTRSFAYFEKNIVYVSEVIIFNNLSSMWFQWSNFLRTIFTYTYSDIGEVITKKVIEK